MPFAVSTTVLLSTLFKGKRPVPQLSVSLCGNDMNELDKFGQFFIQNLRDKSLDYLESMFERKWKAPALQNLQNRVAGLSPEYKLTVR